MVDDILKERGDRYGDFDTHAEITQLLKDVMQFSPNWEELQPYQKEALEMIAHKIGRMLNGDHMYMDNVNDIVGYAQLMKEQMERDNEKANTVPLFKGEDYE